MHDEDADGSGDAGQLRRAVDLGVVHVEADGDAAGGDGLAQAVEKGIQSLVGIELGVRDEAAGVVERGLQEDLHACRRPGAGPRGRRACRTARSDWLNCGFELLVRVAVEQQLPFGEAARVQEAIERGSRQAGVRSCSADRASSRSRVAPVRCGFSRLRRSMRAASCGATARDWPRS